MPLSLPNAMENKDIYHHEVQYRWSFKRGNATEHHYKNDYAISRYSTAEELNLDNVNYAMALKRLGLIGKKIIDFKVTKIYSSKVVGQSNN